MITLQALLRSLAKKSTEPTLTTEEKVYLLLLFNELPEYHEQAGELFSTLSSGNWGWLKTDDVYLVCLRLLAFHRHSADSINGEALAVLASRLIAIERTIGGPYKPAAYSAVQTNAAIAQFMCQLGIPLLNVEQFVQQEAEEHRLVVANPEYGWLLGWPNRIVTVSITRQLQTTDTDSLAQIVAKLCLRLRPGVSKPQDAQEYNSQAEVVSKQIASETSTVAQPLNTLLNDVVNTVSHADSSCEIRLLSTFFAESLSESVGSFSLDEQTTELNKANMYTWMAYTLYDDFIDEEAAPPQLPVANVSHRRAYWLYLTQCGEVDKARLLVEDTFNAMDIANAWEVSNCRFKVDNGTIAIQTLPEYAKNAILADRAGAHILGPLLITLLDTSATHEQYKALRKGLQYYLIARQLNDDVHDWIKDIKVGHISPVVAWLLKEARVEPGTQTIDSLVKSLQDVFWQSGLEAISQHILEHVKVAEQAFEESGLLKKDSAFLKKTLLPIKRSADRALVKHRTEKQFVASYKKVTA